MKKTNRISEEKILQIFELIKSDNRASKITLSECTGLSRQSVHRGIKELINRKWIKESERIGVVSIYHITRRD